MCRSADAETGKEHNEHEQSLAQVVNGVKQISRLLWLTHLYPNAHHLSLSAQGDLAEVLGSLVKAQVTLTYLAGGTEARIARIEELEEQLKVDSLDGLFAN